MDFNALFSQFTESFFDWLMEWVDTASLNFAALHIPIETIYLISLCMMAACFLTIFACFGVRWRHQQQQPQREARQAAWKTFLIHWQAGAFEDETQRNATVSDQMPLVQAHWEDFADVWLAQARLAKHQSEVAMHRLSQALMAFDGLEKMALWLKRGSVQQRMLALGMYAHTLPAQADAWFHVLHWVQSKQMTLSLAAAEALFFLNPGKALPVILDAYGHRADWPLSKVSYILFESHPVSHVGAVLHWLGTLLNTEAERSLPKLLRLLQGSPQPEVPTFLLRMMAEVTSRDVSSPLALPEDEDVVLAILHVLSTLPVLTDLTLAERFATHGDWRYRLKAIRILALHGTAPHQQALLSDALADPEWWVAYRAQEGLDQWERRLTAMPALPDKSASATPVMLHPFSYTPSSSSPQPAVLQR